MIASEPLMQELKAITDYLDSIDPAWRTKIAPAGASGSMTPVETAATKVIGYVTPKGDYANVRNQPNTDTSTILYQIKAGEYHATLSLHFVVGLDLRHSEKFKWYKLGDGKWVREDVVTFSEEKPSPNAGLWPAPVGKYTVTNTHENEHDHDGIDFSCKRGTPVLCGPNGGYVSKIFLCKVCSQESDGAESLSMAHKGYGYGNFVIIRLDYDTLPQAVKLAIPNGAYLYAIHAHLSAIRVSQDQTLQPYELIGYVGATGYTYGDPPDHLHYSLRWSTHPDASWAGMNNNRIDPSLLVKA